MAVKKDNENPIIQNQELSVCKNNTTTEVTGPLPI